MLEVGCGDGALTRRLRERGHDALGIDPEAPRGDGFLATTVERFRADDSFDAAVAIRSLHHVGDLGAAVESLHGALRAHGRLVLFEFAVENVGERERRWQAAAGIRETHAEDVHDVIELGELRQGLRGRFRELTFEPDPYLAREAGREDLLADELDAIARGEIRAVGARLAFDAI